MPHLVAIDLPGGPQFVEALVAAWDRGDAVLPVDQRLSGEAKRRVVEALKPSSIVGNDGRQRLPAGEPVEPGDALVVATSGTTAEPKGVVLTMAAVEASARATTVRLGVDPQRHRWLACLPLNHVGGLSVVTRALLTATPCTVLSGFDAGAVESAAGPEVFVSLVATALQRVGADRFHTVLVGGSAPPAELPANVVTTYGMTETGSGVVYDGVPLDGVEVEVGPGKGTGKGTGTAEIRVRCPMLLRCYRDGLVPLDRHGWFATGDVGRFGTDGRLQVEGRLSELIISGGENVWPSPVEVALISHRGVAEAAVAGVPDREWGQRVVAWIVPSDPAVPPPLEELRTLVAERVAPFAAPKQVVVVDSLPRTSIGKVRRDLLGELDER